MYIKLLCMLDMVGGTYGEVVSTETTTFRPHSIPDGGGWRGNGVGPPLVNGVVKPAELAVELDKPVTQVGRHHI